MKIKAVEIKKICIHICEVVVMWRQHCSVLQGSKNVWLDFVKKVVALQLLRWQSEVAESSHQICLQLKMGKKSRIYNWGPL